MADFKDGNIKFETDLQDFFGFPRGTGIGYMITHAGADGRINKWAKYKPVRSSSVTAISESTRQLCFYGIVRNATTGYWEYAYPRGNSYNPQEMFRAKDFLHYNPDAIAPIKDIAGGYIPEYVNPATQQFTIRYDKIFNFGANVELTLDLFRQMYTASHYIGLLFINNTRGTWHCFTIDEKLETAAVESATHSYGQNIKIDTLGYQSGDNVEVFACCYYRSTGSTPATVSQLDINNGQLIKLAVAADRGRAAFICFGWSFSNITYNGSSGTVNTADSGPMFATTFTRSGSTVTFSRFDMCLRDTNQYQNGTVAYVRLVVIIGSQSSVIPLTSAILNSSTVQNQRIGPNILAFSCNVTENVSPDNDVNLAFYLYLYDSNAQLVDMKQLVSGFLNVNTRYWTISATQSFIIYWNNMRIYDGALLTFSTDVVIMEDMSAIMHTPYTLTAPQGVVATSTAAGIITFSNISSLDSTPVNFSITDSIGRKLTFKGNYSA